MPGTYTVASKLPHGLVLQLQEPYKTVEAHMGGSREVERWRHVGKKVVLKGCSYPADSGQRTQIEGGFALTHGVDADFFDKWQQQNHDRDDLRNGMIFVAAKPQDAIAQAKEFKDELSGFEAVNPSKMPAEFQRKIETAKVEA